MLTEKQFIELAEEGKIRVKFPLRPLRSCLFISYTSSSDELKPVYCKIKKYWQGGYSYKVELIPELEGYEQRSIYTCDLLSIIKSGRAEAFIKL